MKWIRKWFRRYLDNLTAGAINDYVNYRVKLEIREANEKWAERNHQAEQQLRDWAYETFQQRKRNRD